MGPGAVKYLYANPLRVEARRASLRGSADFARHRFGDLLPPPLHLACALGSFCRPATPVTFQTSLSAPSYYNQVKALLELETSLGMVTMIFIIKAVAEGIAIASTRLLQFT